MPLVDDIEYKSEQLQKFKLHENYDQPLFFSSSKTSRGRDLSLYIGDMIILHDLVLICLPGHVIQL